MSVQKKILIYAIVLQLADILTLNAQNRNNSIIRFEKESHDFGIVVAGNQLSYDFSFVNIGATPFYIEEIKTACGCTVVEYPKDSIKANEKGIITLNFNTEGREGKFIKSATVYSNAREGVKVLYIQGEIISPQEYSFKQSGSLQSPHFVALMFLTPEQSTLLRE